MWCAPQYRPPAERHIFGKRRFCDGVPISVHDVDVNVCEACFLWSVSCETHKHITIAKLTWIAQTKTRRHTHTYAITTAPCYTAHKRTYHTHSKEHITHTHIHFFFSNFGCVLGDSFQTCHFSIVACWSTMAVTGHGESVFDSGQGA